jgi:hypothetical protein
MLTLLTLTEEGLGYLDIEKPENYHDLPHKLDDAKGRYVVTTSMTHQLHCLVSAPACVGDKSSSLTF